MNWIPLTSKEALHTIKERSNQRPQVIFKHSTRCSISSMAKSRLERSETNPGIDFYYLDLISYRDVSTAVSELFDVAHQSPQVLVIKNATCIFDESHTSIHMDDIEQEALGV